MFGLDPFDDSWDQGGCGAADLDTFSNYAEFLDGTSPIDPDDFPAGPVEDGCGLSTDSDNLQVAESRVTRQLTAEEKEKYGVLDLN